MRKIKEVMEMTQFYTRGGHPGRRREGRYKRIQQDLTSLRISDVSLRMKYLGRIRNQRLTTRHSVLASLDVIYFLGLPPDRASLFTYRYISKAGNSFAQLASVTSDGFRGSRAPKHHIADKRASRHRKHNPTVVCHKNEPA
jgi:hypothetical protein